MTHASVGKPSPVCKDEEFVMAAAHLDHGHIYGQCNGLVEAGARIKWVFDPVPERVEAFLKKFPDACWVRSFEEILEDPEVQLVAAAAVPNERGPIGCRVMEAGKDYFTDKAPFTTPDQLEQASRTCEATGKNTPSIIVNASMLSVPCTLDNW